MSIWDFLKFLPNWSCDLHVTVLLDSELRKFQSSVFFNTVCCRDFTNMENGMKLQVKLRSHHDYILVLSYVLYNNCNCVLTVKDEPDQQTFKMVWSCVLEFESYFEFRDVTHYCNLMGISFLMCN